MTFIDEPCFECDRLTQRTIVLEAEVEQLREAYRGALLMLRLEYRSHGNDVMAAEVDAKLAALLQRPPS
jgi:hypothetical protein